MAGTEVRNGQLHSATQRFFANIIPHGEAKEFVSRQREARR
jgi:hypothetical protein